MNSIFNNLVFAFVVCVSMLCAQAPCVSCCFCAEDSDSDEDYQPQTPTTPLLNEDNTPNNVAPTPVAVLTFEQQAAGELLDEIDSSALSENYSEITGLKFTETIAAARQLSPEAMLDAALILRSQIKTDQSFRLAEMAFGQVWQCTNFSDAMIKAYKPIAEHLAVEPTVVSEATFGTTKWEYFYSDDREEKKLFYNFGVGFVRHHPQGVATMVQALKKVLWRQIVATKSR